jgi:hypothetical protein
MGGTGAAAGIVPPSSWPSVATVRHVMFTTICPGVTERMTFWPTALSLTRSTKPRTTSSATSADQRPALAHRRVTSSADSCRGP